MAVEEVLTGGKGFYLQANILKQAADALSDKIVVVHDEYLSGGTSLRVGVVRRSVRGGGARVHRAFGGITLPGD
jgi:hypothetical protein